MVFACKVSRCLRSTLGSLAGVEGQAVRVGLESNNSALGEVEDISRNGLFEVRVSGDTIQSKEGVEISSAPGTSLSLSLERT